MFCSECGAVIPDTSKECPNCHHVFPFNMEVKESAPVSNASQGTSGSYESSTTSYGSGGSNSYSQPSIEESPYYAQGGKTGTEPLAIVSLIVSIVSVLLLCANGFGALTAIASLVMSIIARKKADESGRNGRGMGTAAMIISIVTIALGAIVAGVLAPSLTRYNSMS